ncbi:MAG: DUF4199 domain-containing protein [Prevotellaceae bacterium]|nr:DUF4199 domain-containing protein [Prevotellaceae bacterium]
MAAGCGLILGLILSALDYMENITGIQLFMIDVFVFVAGMSYCTVMYRDKCLEGQIGYGTSVLFGILLSAFTFIVIGVYKYIYAVLINPADYNAQLSQAMELMREYGYGASFDDVRRAAGNPMAFTVAYLINGLLVGVLLAPLISLFIKKK